MFLPHLTSAYRTVALLQLYR